MTRGRRRLVFPGDYLTFMVAGVRFVRLSELHERGLYRATAPSGRTYTVTGGHSKRYPWRAVADRAVAGPAGRFDDAGAYSTLVDAAAGVAHVDVITFGRFPSYAPIL